MQAEQAERVKPAAISRKRLVVMNKTTMRPEEKTSITVRHVTRKRLQQILYELQAESGERLNHDKVVSLALDALEEKRSCK
jgi:hypothetical protein